MIAFASNQYNKVAQREEEDRWLAIEKRLPRGWNIRETIMENIRNTVVDNHSKYDPITSGGNKIIEFSDELFESIGEELQTYRKLVIRKYKAYLQKMDEILNSTHILNDKKENWGGASDKEIYYLDVDNKIKKLDINTKLVEETKGYVCPSRIKAINEYREKEKQNRYN